MKKILFLLLFGALLTGCFNRRPTVAELQEKIDSVRALEAKRQMQMKGINLEVGTSPFQMFYDSLNLQPLPLSYSEDYVTSLPDFRPIPPALVTYLDLEGRECPKAIALPETLNSRLVLLAADTEDGQYQLWAYSLDSDYLPIDKLLIYEPSRYSIKRMQDDSRDIYFSITSFIEINVMEYADEEDEVGQLSTYVVDASRLFVELPH